MRLKLSKIIALGLTASMIFTSNLSMVFADDNLLDVLDSKMQDEVTEIIEDIDNNFLDSIDADDIDEKTDAIDEAGATNYEGNTHTIKYVPTIEWLLGSHDNKQWLEEFAYEGKYTVEGVNNADLNALKLGDTIRIKVDSYPGYRVNYITIYNVEGVELKKYTDTDSVEFTIDNNAFSKLTNAGDKDGKIGIIVGWNKGYKYEEYPNFIIRMLNTTNETIDVFMDSDNIQYAGKYEKKFAAINSGKKYYSKFLNRYFDETTIEESRRDIFPEDEYGILRLGYKFVVDNIEHTKPYIIDEYVMEIDDARDVMENDNWKHMYITYFESKDKYISYICFAWPTSTYIFGREYDWDYWNSQNEKFIVCSGANAVSSNSLIRYYKGDNKYVKGGEGFIYEDFAGGYYFQNGKIVLPKDKEIVGLGQQIPFEVIPDKGYVLDELYYIYDKDGQTVKEYAKDGKISAPSSFDGISDCRLCFGATFKQSKEAIAKEQLRKEVEKQNSERIKAIEEKAGDTTKAIIIPVKQAANDTVVLNEKYIKGKVKARTIDVEGVENNKITLNAGTKFILDGKDFSIKNDEANAAKISSKGVLSVKAIKGKPKYDFSVEFTDEAGNKAAVDVTVNNITVDKNIKNTVLFSVAGEVKDSKDDVIKIVSEDLATESYEIALDNSEMSSGIWTLNAGKGDKKCAEKTVSDDGKTIIIKPISGKKGTAKVTCEINGKKYTTSVKILDSTAKKLSAKQKTPVAG